MRYDISQDIISTFVQSRRKPKFYEQLHKPHVEQLVVHVRHLTLYSQVIMSITREDQPNYRVAHAWLTWRRQCVHCRSENYTQIMYVEVNVFHIHTRDMKSHVRCRHSEWHRLITPASHRAWHWHRLTKAITTTILCANLTWLLYINILVKHKYFGIHNPLYLWYLFDKQISQTYKYYSYLFKYIISKVILPIHGYHFTLSEYIMIIMRTNLWHKMNDYRFIFVKIFVFRFWKC